TVLMVLGLIGMSFEGFITGPLSPVLALVTAVPTVIAVMWAYQRLAPPAPPETTVGASLIGKTGIVTKDVRPNSIKGKVKIKNDIWSATASIRIPIGTKIEVVDSEGVHVTVREIKQEDKQDYKQESNKEEKQEV
ncbi:MAG: NfeD family protein, partial [Thermoplasmata archaeon]|nr:NfeD family protein [Thermoplasmata archaeon]